METKDEPKQYLFPWVWPKIFPTLVISLEVYQCYQVRDFEINLLKGVLNLFETFAMSLIDQNTAFIFNYLGLFCY